MIPFDCFCIGCFLLYRLDRYVSTTDMRLIASPDLRDSVEIEMGIMCVSRGRRMAYCKHWLFLTLSGASDDNLPIRCSDNGLDAVSCPVSRKVDRNLSCDGVACCDNRLRR